MNTNHLIVRKLRGKKRQLGLLLATTIGAILYVATRTDKTFPSNTVIRRERRDPHTTVEKLAELMDDLEKHSKLSDLSNNAQENNLDLPKTRKKKKKDKDSLKADLGISSGESDLGMSPAKSDLGRSPGKSDSGRSPGKSDLGISPGNSDLGISPGKSDLGISPGRSDLGRSPESSDLGMLQKKFKTIPCSPVTNIAFVKTHKAGSSTITNILQRYGYMNTLTFALPNFGHGDGYNYISQPGQILTRKALIPHRWDQEYNILCNHAIYNKTAFRMIMPENTVYITILREPISQVESAFAYYGLLQYLAAKNETIRNLTNPLSEFFADPFRLTKSLPKHIKGFVNLMLRNRMATDLGMNSSALSSEQLLYSYISELDTDFSLVMLVEHFDESLLLLKKKLCLTTKDILYIMKNKNTSKQPKHFTSTDRKRHRELSHMDYALYDYFLKKFKTNLDTQSSDFFEELNNFKILLKDAKHACEKRITLQIEESPWYDEFIIDDLDCQFLRLGELRVLDFLVGRHNAQLHERTFRKTPADYS